MTADYEVGYGKPPKETQFKKGQSGNPQGRPKKVRNFRTDFRKEMNTFVDVREGDKTVRMTKRQAMLKALVHRALKGDIKAIRECFQMLASLDPEDAEAVTEDLPREDREILKRFLKQGGLSSDTDESSETNG